MMSPPKLAPLLAEALTYCEETDRLPAEVIEAFRPVIEALALNFAAIEPLGAMAHDALASLESLRATVYGLRERYMPEASRQSIFVVPSTMPLWEIARLVYKDARKVNLLYRANVIVDAAEIPAGTRLVVLPAE